MEDEDLSLAMLRDCGLTLDWQTVYAGWQGFPSQTFYLLQLPRDELQDFAYESLAFAVEVEDQYALVHLIDAKTNNEFQDAMSLHGGALAARSGIPKELAIRKWRYAMVRNCADEIWKENANKGRYGSYSNYVAYVLVQDFNAYIPADRIPEAKPKYASREPFITDFNKLSSWLEEERQRLAELGQIAEPSAPLH